MPNSPLHNLAQKEVSRKEFLGMSLLAVASILGFGTAVKLITGKSLSTRNNARAYSGQSYGGK